MKKSTQKKVFIIAILLVLLVSVVICNLATHREVPTNTPISTVVPATESAPVPTAKSTNETQPTLVETEKPTEAPADTAEPTATPLSTPTASPAPEATVTPYSPQDNDSGDVTGPLIPDD